MSDVDAIRRIDRQIMWNRLLAVVEEQAQTLVRTAFSTTVREAGDVSVGVFDVHGRMLAQAVTGTPGHVNSMMNAVERFLEAYPMATMREGDAYVTNDPWASCGHLHDFTALTPVFLDGRPVASMVCTAHVVDIGGRGLGPDGRSLFEEGLFVPIMPIARAGEVNADLMAIVRANVREPLQVEGDLMSLLTCNEDGARRLVAMMREFGLDALDALADHVVRTSREAVLARLATLPRGRWTAERVRDGYDFPVRLCAALTIGEDGVQVDYAGSSGPSRFGVNVVMNYTTAYTVYALKCLLAPDTPNNSGSLSPFAVTAPEGCILNVKRPWPVAARHIVGHMVPDMVMACLAQVLPDRVPAESSGTIWNPMLRGGASVVDDGVELDASAVPPDFSLYHFNAGGMGARPAKDGLSTTSFPSGVTTQAVEVAETLAPIVFWRKELREDSGGAGRFRGGLGQVIEIGGANGWAISNHSMFDRVEHAALGRDGGGTGALGTVALSDGRAVAPKGKVVVPPGERLVLGLPGGAGFGAPAARDPRRVADDVRAGYVSAGAAARLYGVVLDAAGEVDAAATAAARARTGEGAPG
jgi:N-methylhydantoinase B